MKFFYYTYNGVHVVNFVNYMLSKLQIINITINILLHISSLPALHSYDSLSLLSQSFAKFFSDKIHKLHTSLLNNRISTSPNFLPPFTPPNLLSFSCVTTDGVSKLLSQSPDTNCDLDPIPTSLLKQCSHILLPTITNIINVSLYWHCSWSIQKLFCTWT